MMVERAKKPIELQIWQWNSYITSLNLIQRPSRNHQNHRDSQNGYPSEKSGLDYLTLEKFNSIPSEETPKS
jgi:hypothetical protein